MTEFPVRLTSLKFVKLSIKLLHFLSDISVRHIGPNALISTTTLFESSYFSKMKDLTKEKGLKISHRNTGTENEESHVHNYVSGQWSLPPTLKQDDSNRKI